MSWRPPYTIVDLNAILGVPKGSGKLVNDYVHLNDLLELDKYSFEFFLNLKQTLYQVQWVRGDIEASISSFERIASAQS